APAIRAQKPAFVLFPHSYQSMEYFPRLAHEVDGGIISALGGLRQQDGQILWTRPVLGGKLQADVRVKAQKDAPVLASIQPGAIAADKLRAGSGTVEALSLDALAALQPDREILGVESAAKQEVDLTKAEIIVAAGRGVGGADKMGVVHDLAQALGADVGASRPVIDNGRRQRDPPLGAPRANSGGESR